MPVGGEHRCRKALTGPHTEKWPGLFRLSFFVKGQSPNLAASPCLLGESVKSQNLAVRRPRKRVGVQRSLWRQRLFFPGSIGAFPVDALPSALGRAVRMRVREPLPVGCPDRPTCSRGFDGNGRCGAPRHVVDPDAVALLKRELLPIGREAWRRGVWLIL